MPSIPDMETGLKLALTGTVLRFFLYLLVTLLYGLVLTFSAILFIYFLVFFGYSKKELLLLHKNYLLQLVLFLILLLSFFPIFGEEQLKDECC